MSGTHVRTLNAKATRRIQYLSRLGLSGQILYEFTQLKRKVDPDLGTFTSAIGGLCRSKKPAHWAAAVELHREMESYFGLQPSLTLMGFLMRLRAPTGIAKDHRHGFFLSLRSYLAFMEASKTIPSTKIFSCILSGIVSTLSPPSGRLMRKVFAKMLALQLDPDPVVFAAICLGYSRAQKLDLMVQTVHEMQHTYHLTPNALVYTAVIDGFGKAGELDEMMRWFALMRKTCGADHVAYNAVITAFGKAKDTQKMVEMYGFLIAGLADNTVKVCPSAADAGGLRELLEPALEMRKQLSITYATLIEGFATRRNRGGVAWVHKEMREHGISMADLRKYAIKDK